MTHGKADEMQPEYAPSPMQFVLDQIESYEASGGADNLDSFYGLPCVILCSIGVKTGKLRKTPVMRVEADGSYAVIASYAGNERHPAWYFNLLAHPEVSLQDGPVVRALTAREVHGDEKQVWWNRAITVFDKFDEYQAMTLRSIPLLVLESRTA
jgi:deazaflavin-dependent oxidoreductase (nitroreductase family)